MATPSFTPPPLDNTLGAGYIGVFVSSALYGLTCLQTYNYFNQQATKKDPIFLKSCVICLWVVETLHSACIAHAMYFYSVSHFGNYLTLTTAVWSIILPVGLTCLNAWIVQSCFAWRVYIMSDKNKPIVFLIALVSIIQLCTGWVMTGIGFKIRQFADLIHYKALVTSSLTSSAVTDLLIAVSLCYYLHTKRSGIKSTDTLIQKLIIYALNCGVLCSLVAVAGLITFLTMPNNLVNYALNWILGKVYSNSLLSTLNARSHLRETRGGAGAIALDLVESKPSFSPHQPSGVTVTTVTESTSATQVGKFGASESEFKMQEF